MENIFGIQMGNREKQGETETMGKNIGSGIHTSTSEKNGTVIKIYLLRKLWLKYWDTWDSK